MCTMSMIFDVICSFVFFYFCIFFVFFFFFFQAEDGIRDAQESRGLGDVYKRQVKELHKAVTLNGGLPRVFSMDMDYLCDIPVSKGNIGSSSSSMRSTPHMGSDHRTKPPSGLRTQSTSKVGAQEAVSEGSASPWYYLVMMRGLDIIRDASKDEIYSHVTADFGIARELFDLLSSEAAHDKLRMMLPGQQADNGGASALYDLFINGAFTDLQHLETLLADHDGDQSALTKFSLEVAEYDGAGTRSQSHTQGNPPSDDDVE
eukprot:TRINITY_DN4033_c0_g1_i6.p1 TRINITY_DN4033_c0_g1~~TRINITY_DN4033_c0_g1_i6.p1  ORF type:complete len:260 (-),score=58.81 TRINITY_DN4033_c0_g1_i6:238-1017(-)